MRWLNWLISGFKKSRPKPSYMEVTCESGEKFKIQVAKLELIQKSLHATSCDFVKLCTVVSVKLLDSGSQEIFNYPFAHKVIVDSGDSIQLMVRFE